jgi:hypothetical protein
VNKFIFAQNGLQEFNINVPIQSSWDFEGLDDAIDQYEANAIKEVIGVGYDFEVNRFPHAPNSSLKTDINYEFNFFTGGSLDNQSSWQINYIPEGFTTQDIFYYSNKFSNSFFKLDFYDTVDEKKQKNYFTVILPTQQGEMMPALMAQTPVYIKKPKYKLDYIGDKEGFFIYWLKNLKFLPINTFYMTAKFYNAGTGQFTKMMNKPQSTINGNKYVFDQITYFYYRVVLNYIDQNYTVLPLNSDTRIGTEDSPIKWYEYINPPL